MSNRMRNAPLLPILSACLLVTSAAAAQGTPGAREPRTHVFASPGGVDLKAYVFACMYHRANSTDQGGPMRSTREVIDHHLECFGRGDLDGILADYSSTAVMLTPTGVLQGPSAMRPVFQALFTEFGQAGTTFSMKHRSVDGDYAYFLWSAETADNVYELGTDTFVVRNDQILAHSFALKTVSKR